MSLAVDASRALRSPHELSELVDAILGASENDESDWIEWKSALGLHEKGAQGTIARNVLGMANRQPDYAARYAGGCGYIVIGAEPGNCIGVDEIDPAVLSQGIQRYLGAEGPGWGAQYVHHHGKSVLVVTVEPPRSGDRIFTLQKEFIKYRAGTVFVRRQMRPACTSPTRSCARSNPTASGHWNATSIATSVPGSATGISRFCGLASPWGKACGS